MKKEKKIDRQTERKKQQWNIECNNKERIKDRHTKKEIQTDQTDRQKKQRKTKIQTDLKKMKDRKSARGK